VRLPRPLFFSAYGFGGMGETSTRFLPRDLAWYIAASARAKIESVSQGRSTLAMPSDAVTCTVMPEGSLHFASKIAFRRRSAATRAPASLVCGKATTNSSPPQRPTMSLRRAMLAAPDGSNARFADADVLFPETDAAARDVGLALGVRLR